MKPVHQEPFTPTLCILLRKKEDKKERGNVKSPQFRFYISYNFVNYTPIRLREEKRNCALHYCKQ